jgi:hypothetical protein
MELPNGPLRERRYGWLKGQLFWFVFAVRRRGNLPPPRIGRPSRDSTLTRYARGCDCSDDFPNSNSIRMKTEPVGFVVGGPTSGPYLGMSTINS